MSKQIHCHACSTQFAVSQELFAKHFAGKKAVVKCRRCGAHITVDSRETLNLGPANELVVPNLAQPDSPELTADASLSLGDDGSTKASTAGGLPRKIPAKPGVAVRPAEVLLGAAGSAVLEPAKAGGAEGDETTAVAAPPPTLGRQQQVPAPGINGLGTRASSPVRQELRAALTSRAPAARAAASLPVGALAARAATGTSPTSSPATATSPARPPGKPPAELRGTLMGLQSPPKPVGLNKPTVPEQPSAKHRPKPLDATIVGVAPPSPGSAGPAQLAGFESAPQRSRPEGVPQRPQAIFSATMAGVAPPANAIDDLSVIAELPPLEGEQELTGDGGSPHLNPETNGAADDGLAAFPEAALDLSAPQGDHIAPDAAAGQVAPQTMLSVEDEDTAVYPPYSRGEETSEAEGSERLAVTVESVAPDSGAVPGSNKRRSRGGLIAAAALLLSAGGAGLFWWQGQTGAGAVALPSLASPASGSDPVGANAPETEVQVQSETQEQARGASAGVAAAPMLSPETASTAPSFVVTEAEAEAEPVAEAELEAEPVAKAEPEAEPVAKAEPETDEPSAPAHDLAPARVALGSAPGYDAVPASVDPQRVTYLMALALKRARRCHLSGRATGTATVFVSFGQDGKTTDAHLVGEPIASAPVGRCILGHVGAVQLQPFEDAPFIVSDEITLR